MNTIDVLNTGINVNGHILDFPMSYKEIEEVLGEARIVEDEDMQTSYYYDELGLAFDGSPEYLSNLKRKKAYKDKDAEKLRKICEPLGITVEPIATVG